MEPNSSGINETSAANARTATSGSTGIGGSAGTNGTTGTSGSTRTAQPQSLIDKAKESAQERVQSAVSSTTSAASVALSSVAQSLLLSSQQLRDQQHGASSLVEKAAEKLDQAAQYLEGADVDRMVRRTESWARRNPALFLGGAFVLGVIGARFLKSSGSNVRTSDDHSGSSASFADRQVPTVIVEEG